MGKGSIRGVLQEHDVVIAGGQSVPLERLMREQGGDIAEVMKQP
ncbi:hypothetical protein ACPW96_18200 [Micromonospora sp. DT81.3]